MYLGHVRFLFGSKGGQDKKRLKQSSSSQLCAELERPFHLLYEQGYRNTSERCRWKVEKDSIVSGPGKLTFFSRNVITMWCYNLEKRGAREWGREYLPFYRLQPHHLAAFDKTKWGNHISGSFTLSLGGKRISLFIYYHYYYLVILFNFPTVDTILHLCYK